LNNGEGSFVISSFKSLGSVAVDRTTGDPVTGAEVGRTQLEYEEFKFNSSQVLHSSLFPTAFNYANLLLNIGSSLLGAGELGSEYIRTYNMGPTSLRKGIENLFGRRMVGTQAISKYLKNVSNGARTWGKRIGGIGFAVSLVDYVANSSEKNGYEHLNFWLGTGIFLVYCSKSCDRNDCVRIWSGTNWLLLIQWKNC
jgi:hypothetical protein